MTKTMNLEKARKPRNQEIKYQKEEFWLRKRVRKSAKGQN